MAIVNPSQYDCDNMEQGDLIVVKYRNPIYKWYRSNFQKDKIKIKIRVNWGSNEIQEAYQEDCTLLFSWEVYGKYEMKDTVPYYLGYKNRFIKLNKKFQNIVFGNENINLILKNGLSILVPTRQIREGIRQLDTTTGSINEQKQVKEALKFARYNGDFFEKRVKELDIKSWDISYCTLCGKPTRIDFSNDKPHIYNECDCGYVKTKDEEVNYDVVAYWYNRQVVDVIKNRYKEFWKI